MRQLEDDAEEESRGQVHGQESEQDLPPREVNDHQRDGERVAIVDSFADEQNHDLRRSCRLSRYGPRSCRSSCLIVLNEHPEQRRAGIQRERVEMLQPVEPQSLGVRRETEQR